MTESSSTIPDIRSSPDEWYKYFDHVNTNKLSKNDMVQALVDTINALTGSLPDIEQLMESFETMWSISSETTSDGSIAVEMSLEQFKKEGGMWELIVASGLLPAITPIPVSSTSSSSYNNNMNVGSGVGSGYNYDYEAPRSMRVVW